MKSRLILCLAVLGLAAGCSNESSSTPAKSPQTNAAAPAATSPNAAENPGSYAGGLVRAQQLATKTADLTPINEAIRMFQVEKGRFPKDLNELVQDKYLPRLPQPPTGTRYDYNPSTGKVILVQ